MKSQTVKPQAKPEQKNDKARSKAKAPAVKGNNKTVTPAYLKAKMKVSRPGDAQEQEADQVAERVSRKQKDTAPEPQKQVQRSALKPGQTSTEDEQAISRKPAGEDEKKEQEQTLSRQEKNPEPTGLARMSDETVPENKEETIQGKGDLPELSEETEQQINALRGNGDTLPESVRNDMERELQADFSNVRIHTDGTAANLAAGINARAFTVGNDIFFGAGEYAPETTGGRKLLVHELTHVMQNSADSDQISREVSPSPTPEPASGSAAESRLADISVLEIPPIKHRHAALYTGAGARRAAGYSRNTSQQQITVWNNGIQLPQSSIEEKIRALYQARGEEFTTPTDPTAPVNFLVGSNTLSTPWRSLRERLLIPDWDRRGRMLSGNQRFQVDHMVELQVFGDTTGNAGNVIGNLELLKGSPNMSSGPAIAGGIKRKVRAFLQANDPDFGRLRGRERTRYIQQWLDTHTITFTTINRGTGRAGSDQDWWTRTEIESLAPLDAVRPAPAQRLQGSSGNFVLASGAGGVEISRYRYSDLQFQPRNERQRKALAGIRINEFQLNAASEQGNAGDSIGSLSATWDLPNGFRAGEAVNIPLVAVAPYCGAPGVIPGLNTNFDHLSPVSFPQIELRDGHLYASGQINPSVPLLRDHPITATLDGNDLRFEMQYSMNMLSLPIPGLSLDRSTLSLFFSTQEGFGGGGQVDFSIAQLGSGNLEVQVSQRNGFSAEGGFDFDSDLFDRSNIRVWYRNNAFGGEGEIGIDDSNKIKGIRSANLRVGFATNQFNATGDVQPNIPGIQQAGLVVAYSEPEGLLIGGNIQLSSDVPGIESGSIEVALRKREEQWKVAANGTAVPSIPGISSQLTVAYDDGAFNAEIEAAFSRGMLGGQAHVGVTNRTLDSEGNPTGEPGEGMTVFGSGSATLQIAPWLQGTVGIAFDPAGEVTVVGEVGLPSSIELLPRKEVNKRLFSVGTSIPIVPGIVARISGGAEAVAGFGPGQLDQMNLRVTYSPSHEENTHIEGGAHLNIPADAGIRLFVRGGIGLGIPGASATGGLEVGGQLGIAGAAEASVDFDWTPTTGLEINAEGYIHAQPKFVFDISGFVEVEALWVTVYENRWNFASFEYGSDLAFGVRFPIHYKEGEPFDIALSDVQFETPDINAGQILDGLIDRIA